jgi:AcrR family transcriptional regulator
MLENTHIRAEKGVGELFAQHFDCRSKSDNIARMCARRTRRRLAHGVGGKMAATKNRNALRSIRLLEEALTLLIAEKPYDKITVTDITRRADLNRGTFYAHFQSVDQLMNQTMDDLTERLSASLSPLVSGSFFQDPMPLLQRIGDFVCDNLALIRKLVDNDRLGPFLTAIMNRLAERLHKMIRQEYPDAGDYPVQVVDFVLGGVRDSYGSWLEGTYGRDGVDELNQNLCRLIVAVGSTLDEKVETSDPGREG